jgi:hypothetical protein
MFRRTAVILLLPFMVIAGCATPRSATMSNTEVMQAFYVPAEDGIGDHVATETIVIWFLGRAVDLLQKVLEEEASSYTANYGGALEKLQLERVGTGPSSDGPPILIKGGWLVILRAIKVPEQQDADMAGIPTLSEHKGELINRLTEIMSVGGAAEIEKMREVVIKSIVEPFERECKDGQRTKLAFCGVVRLRAADRGERADAMQMKLAAYYYPILKAKNATIDLPLIAWSHTESELSVTVESKAPVGGVSEYQWNVSWPVEWAREAALKGGPADWRVVGEGVGLSEAKYIPRPDVVLNAKWQVAESSELGELILLAAERGREEANEYLRRGTK